MATDPQAWAGEGLTGPAGVATEVLVNETDRGSVASWFLRCPNQSPAWDCYVLSVVHLRPVDGQPPAIINLPGATHEVLLIALDPATEPEPTKIGTWRFLRPINVAEQVILPDDEAAVQIACSAARAVVEGVLPAEPLLAGAMEPWRTSMIKTAAHLRGEDHAP